MPHYMSPEELPPPGEKQPPRGAHRGKRKKNAVFLVIALFVAFVVLLFALVASVVTFAAGGIKPSEEPTPLPSILETKTERPKGKEKPKTLMELEGSGTKSSETFTVDGSWKLHYEYNCKGNVSNFTVSIAGEDGLDVPVVNEFQERGKSKTDQKESGEVHLKMNSICDWSVKAVDSP